MKYIKLVPFLSAFLLLLIPLAASADSDYGLEWYGTLTSRPAGTVGTWVVGTMSFQATGNTWLSTEHGVPTAGSCVNVHYITSNGVNYATEIDSEPAYKCGTGYGGGGYGGGEGDDYDGGYDHHEGSEYEDDDDGHGGYGTRGLWKSYGVISTVPAAPYYGTWRIGVTNYTANTTTRFEQKHGYFGPGTCVEFKQVGGVLLEVETSEQYHCSGSGASTSPGQHYAQHYGVVGAFPANLVGTWTVSGTLYSATSTTRFEQERGPFFVGGCVEIKLLPNTTTALEISVEDAYKCTNTAAHPIERDFYGVLTGTIPSGYVGDWDINDGVFHSTSAPTIDTENGALDPGDCVGVEYESGENITHISTRDPYECNTNTFTNQVYGNITSFPAGLYGTWIIDGDSRYNAGSGASFDQSHGLFANGACVKVKYYAENGIHHITEIETESSSHCGGGTPSLPGSHIKLYATIDSFPASPYAGAWSIGGVSFTAGPATLFEQNHGAFGNGVCVEAKYTAGASAPFSLLKVETTESYKCNQSSTNPTPQFKSYGYVEAMPTGTLTGTWQVSGVSYTANNSTRFEQQHGFFTVGAYVEVKYDASKTATSIETHVAPGSGRKVVAGHLDTRPADDWGDWVIDGETYHADPAIQVGDDGLGSLSVAGISASAAPVQGQTVIATMYTTNGVNYIVTANNAIQFHLPIIRK